MEFQISPQQALLASQRLIALGLLQQSVEFVGIRHAFGPGGVWSWEILRRDFLGFPKSLIFFFDYVLNDGHFFGVIILQMVLAGMSVIHPNGLCFLGLFLTHTLICLRWRGTFNGGSDFMTVVVRIGVLVARSGAETSRGLTLGLAYVGFQSIASYWVAGISKISSKYWRSGAALRAFLAEYGGSVGEGWVLSPRVSKVLTGLILAFECSFPLALLNSRICLFYLGIGFCFHFSNSILLGLNRFILPWFATYPALLFLSQFRPWS